MEAQFGEEIANIDFFKKTFIRYIKKGIVIGMRFWLVFASILFILAMLLFVPWISAELGPSNGMLIVFCLYWFGFCLPLGLLFQGREKSYRNLSLAVGNRHWVPMLVLVQVGVVAIANWLLLPSQIPILAFFLAIIFGSLNGFSEEFFWRGAYLVQGRGQPGYQAVGVILFGLWHVPLALAVGVTYEGGASALIGRAIGLGLFWSIIANRTNRIGWTIVAHVMTNVVGFVGLIATNFI